QWTRGAQIQRASRTPKTCSKSLSSTPFLTPLIGPYTPHLCGPLVIGSGGCTETSCWQSTWSRNGPNISEGSTKRSWTSSRAASSLKTAPRGMVLMPSCRSITRLPPS
ncbi:hypothetical protein FRC17_008353, partial [Serendipita sp. 399]